MTKKKTTIHDIAKELNVTASTVSRALNDHPNISLATKKIVLATAKRMNYQPNSIAAALRNGKSNTVGVIVPEVNRFFFSTIIKGIEEVVSKAGYNVIICQSNDSVEKEKESINSLLKLRVDGILVSHARELSKFEHFQEVLKKNVPLILFDRTDDSLDVGSVVIDDYLGAFWATEHLIQQGCKRVIHFSGPQNVSSYRERQRGYIDAMKQYNLPVPDSFIIDSQLKYESGYEHGGQILKWDCLPDGIYAASDYSAIGAMTRLKESGVKIPEQVAVVGLADEPFTTFVDPPLSSINLHAYRMGQIAAQIFLDQINRKQNFYGGKTVLKPELLIRSSSIKNPES
jgi:LacI family transcriptional regulator